MLGKDNKPKRKSSNKDEITKRTKKSSIRKTSVKKTNTEAKGNGIKKSTTPNVAPKKEKEQPKKQVKKVKKVKKPLTEKQVRVRNILIAALTIFIIGGLCIFAIVQFKKHENVQKQSQQQVQNVDGFTDQQLITAANAYQGNVQYDFKSVINKSKNSSGDLVATLMATEENNGVYNTTKVNVTYEVANNQPLVINMSAIGTETRNVGASENSAVVQSKENVTYEVLDYLKSTGMNVNDTNWAMDIEANKTVDGQEGYLVNVYKLENGQTNSVDWIFVSNNGEMYSVGPNGTGSLTPIQS